MTCGRKARREGCHGGGRPALRPSVFRSRPFAGFTLIELLVVVAIISLLAALLLPSLKTARARARVVACQSNLHQIYIGCSLYADDFGDKYPPYNHVGSPPGAPSYSYWLLDSYVGIRNGVHYDSLGPLGASLYFCPEYVVRFRRGMDGAAKFGFSVNKWYVTYYHIVGETWPGMKRTDIPAPDYTLFMRELNPRYVDVWMSGTDVWPLNRITGLASPYSIKYPRLHLDGGNVMWFDGRARHYSYPRAVECQLYPGFDYTNYSGWEWP